MNSSTPPPDDGFEAELAQYQRAALPAEWRDELLSRALPDPDQASPLATSRRARFSRPERILAGAMALTWIAILSLELSRPEAAPLFGQSQKASTASPPPSSESPARDFPMLAWRAQADTNSAPPLLLP